MKIKNTKVAKQIALFITTLAITIPQISAAQLYNPLGTASVPQIIGRIIQAILGITGSLALLMFIYGGFLWLTSVGNPGKIEKGQKTLVYSVIGLAIIFGSYALSTFVIERLAGVAT